MPKQSIQPTHSQHIAARNIWRAEPKRESAQFPLISVVIPVYQEEKIIENLLIIFSDTIRKTYRLEIIVSDGGSSDATVCLSKKYADVIVVHSDTSRRQTIAEGRNVGAEISLGETIVFINADTLPAEPILFFDSIYQWTMLRGKYEHCGALSSPVEVFPSQRKWSDVLFHNFFNNYLKVLSLCNVGVGRGECQIVRAETFHALGGYNSNLAAGEDFEFFRRVVQSGRIAVANELLVYESPRRYRKLGYIRILFQWFLNWCGALFFKKSVSKEWEVIR